MQIVILCAVFLESRVFQILNCQCSEFGKELNLEFFALYYFSFFC